MQHVEAVGSVASCEMLFRTNIWAIIPGGMRPKVPENILQFYDESQKKAIMEIKFAAAVKSVRFRRDNAPVYLQAHKNKLACIAINQQSKRIATASEQGTLIRVWDTSTRN
ncbi:hypothetical protein YQE_02970, partial [Dendroctonus ponderosae]